MVRPKALLSSVLVLMLCIGVLSKSRLPLPIRQSATESDCLFLEMALDSNFAIGLVNILVGVTSAYFFVFSYISVLNSFGYYTTGVIITGFEAIKNPITCFLHLLTKNMIINIKSPYIVSTLLLINPSTIKFPLVQRLLSRGIL